MFRNLFKKYVPKDNSDIIEILKESNMWLTINYLENLAPKKRDRMYESLRPGFLKFKEEANEIRKMYDKYTVGA